MESAGSDIYRGEGSFSTPTAAGYKYEANLDLAHYYLQFINVILNIKLLFVNLKK